MSRLTVCLTMEHLKPWKVVFFMWCTKKTSFRTSGALCLTDDGTCFSIKEKLDPSEWKRNGQNVKYKSIIEKKRRRSWGSVGDRHPGWNREAVGVTCGKCPVIVMCSGSPVEVKKQLCGLPRQHQPGTKKWQAFNGSFWRWLLYYSGSANLTQPNEDLAPRHLLVSHFIMSSSSVHACPGILGVCSAESPRQRRNKDWAAIWKNLVWFGQK